jgi:hypothetical protein
MTRQPHDQLAKEYLEELLSPLGKVETSRDVRSEVTEIDVWFVPTTPPVTNPPNLGLLSQMAATSWGESSEAVMRGRIAEKAC